MPALGGAPAPPQQPPQQQRRTADVLSAARGWGALLLPPALEAALRGAGFRRPSPVQEAALPLARLGADLIVQAKAGTGKTLVFAAAAAERVDLGNPAPQARRRRRPALLKSAQPAKPSCCCRRPPSKPAPPCPAPPLAPIKQVLVLAPTREIALQAAEAVALAAAALPPPGLAVGTFIGGLPVEEDERQLRRCVGGAHGGGAAT